MEPPTPLCCLASIGGPSRSLLHSPASSMTVPNEWLWAKLNTHLIKRRETPGAAALPRRHRSRPR